MKKILSIMLVLAMVFSFSITTFAATDITNYSKDSVIEVETDSAYELALGASGENIRITEATVSGEVIATSDIKITQGKFDVPAIITLKTSTYYGVNTRTATLRITYKDMAGDKKTQRLNIKLDIIPKEVDVDGFEFITNGIVYNFTNNDSVEFDFDGGTYFAKISDNQKSVNLSYIHEITNEIIEQYPSVVDVVVFKGVHSFNLYGNLVFNGTRNGDKVYIYEVTENGLVALPYNATKDTYEIRTRVLGTYLISNEELTLVSLIEEPSTEGIPNAEPSAPININDNPSTGR